MQRRSRPLTDVVLSIVIPSVILMNFSGAEDLGVRGALVVALAFPVAVGLHELLRFREPNYIALLGVVSVLLTGGIGLLELDPWWLAVKEAAVPALLGTVVLVAARLGYPLIRVLLYNPQLVDTRNLTRILCERGHTREFEARLLNATYLLGGTFFFSAVMNFWLTRWIVTSPAGSAAFNEELGRLALFSYPVIAIPSMMMMLAIMYFLWRSIRGLTGLTLEDILAPSLANRQ